jgi:hypothetical protein
VKKFKSTVKDVTVKYQKGRIIMKSRLSMVLMGSLMLLALCGSAFAFSSLLLTPATNALSINGSTVYSTNWSGYAVTGSSGSVTSASGSWTVPTLVSTSGTALAAFWVGIDGYSSNTVEQTGTLIATPAAQTTYGVPAYSAWYEFYPAGMVIIPDTVKAGDVISASVTYTGTSATTGFFGSSGFFARDPRGRSTSTFTVTITDITGGWTYSATGTVRNAARSSAEWIAEAPSSYSGVLPLANFGTVSFGSDSTGVTGTCYATVNGVTGSIASFSSNVAITMVNSKGVTKASPSLLSADGTSFSVTWASAGP